jgi:phosphoribosylformylglycinamidine synthase
MERDGLDAATLLFSESTGRVIVSVPRSEEVRFTDMCSARRLPHARIGVVDEGSTETGGPTLDVQGRFSIGLDELGAVWRAPLRELFGA